MVDIKQALHDSLTDLLPQLTNVAKVKTYLSNEAIIEDAEKLVFTESALAIGDLISDKGFFSTGYDLNEIDVTIFLLLKNQSARDYADDNIRIIKEHLRNQRLQSSTITMSHVNEHGQPVDITNRVSYIELNWHVVQHEPLDPTLEEELDEWLRNATGLTAGHVLTATGDSTWDFLNPQEAITQSIQFDVEYTPPEHVEGLLHWDVDNNTLSLDMPGGEVELQIGQEALVRVRNESGTDILNGKLVYTTGSSGNKPTIGLCYNNDSDKIHVLGMTTEDIPNNSNGFVCIMGHINGSATQPLNTSAFSEGTKLYMGTAGDWIAIHPASPMDAIIIIGEVQRQHATEGRIFVHQIDFTIGNNLDGILRQSIMNKSPGVAAASVFTSVNDVNNYVTMGVTGSNNTVFGPNLSVFYNHGLGDHWNVVDGAKDFIWFTDPTDAHDFSALSNEVMRLTSDGNLGIGINNPTEKLHVDGRIIEEGTYGEIYADNGTTAQNIPSGATYTKLTGFTADGHYKNIALDASNGTITFTKAGRYLISCAISASSGTANTTFTFAAFVDGILHPGTECHRKFANAADAGASSLTGIIDVPSEGLELDIRATHDFGQDVNLTPSYMNLNTIYLGET